MVQGATEEQCQALARALADQHVVEQMRQAKAEAELVLLSMPTMKTKEVNRERKKLLAAAQAKAEEQKPAVLEALARELFAERETLRVRALVRAMAREGRLFALLLDGWQKDGNGCFAAVEEVRSTLAKVVNWGCRSKGELEVEPRKLRQLLVALTCPGARRQLLDGAQIGGFHTAMARLVQRWGKEDPLWAAYGLVQEGLEQIDQQVEETRAEESATGWCIVRRAR